MELARLKEHLAQKPGSVEDFPFGPETLVYKVGGKVFALVALDDNPLRINVKCDPDEAEALRAMYPAVVPGYHMNKRHWNTVVLDGSIEDDVIFGMIDFSYELIVKSLTRAARESLEGLLSRRRADA